MTLIARKMLHGATFVRDSVRLLINHPVLLMYTVAAFIIHVAISLVVLPHFQKAYLGATSSSMDTFLFIVLPHVMTIISLLCLACVAHHAMHVLQGELASIQETLRGVARRFFNLLLWFIIVLAYQHIIIKLGIALFNCPRAPHGLCTLLYNFMVGVITLSSSLVLPIIATESTNVFTAIARICSLVWYHFAVFLGAFIVLFGINFMQMWLVGLFDTHQVIALYVLNILISPLSILTYTIFYFEYYARPRPELADIFTPDI